MHVCVCCFCEWTELADQKPVKYTKNKKIKVRTFENNNQKWGKKMERKRERIRKIFLEGIGERKWMTVSAKNKECTENQNRETESRNSKYLKH